MSILGLSTPLPGFGHAISAREYAMQRLSLDTNGQDGIFSRGTKTFINTAIRCTAYSLPYLIYSSCSSFTFLSQYANLGMGLGKGIYSVYSYVQGYTQKDDNKINLAKKMAKEAILHAAFAYLDKKTLDFGAKVIIPMITTYVGFGALIDLFGKSKQIHNKLFSSSTEDIRNEDLSYEYDANDSDSEVNVRNSRRFMRSQHEVGAPFPSFDAAGRRKRNTTEIRWLMKAAKRFQEWDTHHRKLHVGSR